MTTVAPKLLTAMDFARLPQPVDGARQELVHGVVITTPPLGHTHGRIQWRIARLFGVLKDKGLGQVTTSSGVITTTDPDTVRGPDVAFWRADRLSLETNPDVYPDIVPDLCVEILSPGNTPARMTRKVREYFQGGAAMVWVVDPEARTLTIYRRPGEGQILWEEAAVSAEDILPGFICKVADFFPPQPNPPQS